MSLNLLNHISSQSKFSKQTLMDQLSLIAKAYYEGGSSSDQESAQRFFRSLDDNGDEQISVKEFLGFMRQEGYQNMNNPYFFRSLDRDNNGALDFWEVMTLYYIIKSGRPFCEGCGEFLPSLFFACVECFCRASQGSCVCITCYEQGNFIHRHNRSCFYDNFTLLEIKRKEQANQNEMMQQPASTSQVKLMQQPASTSQVIQVYHPTRKWSVALAAFELSLAMGRNFCSIM